MSFEKMEKIFAMQLEKSKEKFETSRNKVANCLKYQSDEECRKKVQKFNRGLVNYDNMHKTYFSVLDSVLKENSQQFNDTLEKNYSHLELENMINLPEKLSKLKSDYSHNTKQYLASKKKTEEFKEKMVSTLHQVCIQEHSSYWRNCEDLHETSEELNNSIKKINKMQEQNKKAPFISTLESLLVQQKFFESYNQYMEEQRLEKQNDELVTQYTPF